MTEGDAHDFAYIRKPLETRLALQSITADADVDVNL